MPSGLLEWVAGQSHGQKHGSGFAITPAVVKDNLNILGEGRVRVHIPERPEMDPWARMASVGGGSGRGFLWIPQVGDEVLVAFNRNDSRDVYVIGGLWSTLNRPPVVLPTDMMTKRVIKTGMSKSPIGHSIEFDDALQSITITTSSSQKITMDPKQIQISAALGTLTITMSTAAAPPGISIQSVGNLTLKAEGALSIEGASVSISGKAFTDISSEGNTSVGGTFVMIN